MDARRTLPTLAALLLSAPIITATVYAQQAATSSHAAVGTYRLAEGPDVAAQLVIHADGHFDYALAAGALDERASGRWTVDGADIRLTTEPRPRPPEFGAATPTRAAGSGIAIVVNWPNGNGIAGVDFTIGFDKGDPISGYTQYDGWHSQDGEARTPRWIELTEPIHGIVSPRYRLDAASGNVFTFILTPNDIGVVAFDGARLELTATGTMLHRGDGRMRFVRDTRYEPAVPSEAP